MIAMEHTNLFRVIGNKPEEVPDPRRNEKHNFFIVVTMNGEETKLTPDDMERLPSKTLAEINRALSAGKPVDVEEAKTIMGS